MLDRQYKILIIDTDVKNIIFLTKVLINLGHDIIHIEAEAEAIEDKYISIVDFIFIDINLKCKNAGFYLIKKMKKQVPIIYMTYSDTKSLPKEINKTNIYGYMIKPLTKVLVETTLYVAINRLVNLLHKPSLLQLGNKYNYDLISHTLKENNELIHLTKKEEKLLYFFITHRNQNVSYLSLEKNIWKKKVSLSTIRDSILRLRKKAPHLHVENIFGVGYHFS
jgi:DNA-binding response OmpR family regulator